VSKRVLMIADADGQWTRRYIEYLLLPQGYEVVLFPIWGNRGVFADFYRENGVTVYKDTHKLPLVRHIPRLRMWARIWLNARELVKLGPFDIIHNHYLSARDLALGSTISGRLPKAKWVCSFWGSDLLRSTEAQHARMRPYLERCSAITIHSALQFEEIRKHYGQAVADKAALVYFGQIIYKDIDRVRAVASQAACKAHFGIDPSRKVVCVGYNASKAQHQPQVLRALEALPPETRQNLTVILQLTYGDGGAEHIREVREAARGTGCEALLYTEYMNGTESAYLRLCADAFILAIETDSFSASLQEYLYAGARVLTAAWLTYPQLEELGIETASFAEYGEIPALLENALNHPLTEEEAKRRALLGDTYSWEAVSDAWLKLYR
jgi:glycosyltransferase involved in cell wall biosynthesis